MQRLRQLLTPAHRRDFEEFLKAYAAADHDDVRRRYTIMPLEREGVTEYLVENAPADAPPVTVIETREPDRDRYFAYRYIARLDDYREIGVERQFLQEALSSPAWPNKYPRKVEAIAGGDRLVQFGTETEIDIYLFKRRDGCWYLKRATDTRD